MGEASYQLILKEHRIEETARKYVDLFMSGSCEQSGVQAFASRRAREVFR
jgi:hypothetical protein